MPVFVGRERELKWLEDRLDRAHGGHGRVVFLTGEPGAGKSSLVSQFLVNTALRIPDARLIGADCSEQFGAAEPYEPFVEAFRDLVTEEKPGTRTSSLRELAAEVAPAWLQAIPVAGALISATVTTAREIKKGSVANAAPSEEALFFQYTELFFAAASKSTVVFVIDDLHWADAASVSLLTHLGRRIKDKPVLIIGTFRPADVDITHHPIRDSKLELERYGVCDELPLPPLDSSALARLVEEQLEAPATPELLDWLTRHAGENPLFFTELLKWLVDQGFAQQHRDEWALVRVPELIEVPRSAESAIERRLSRLAPEVYKVVEYASVAGNEFDSTSLAQLLTMDELELEEALEPVVRVHRLARLIDTRELPSGDLASVYHFSHSLIQDVLHKNLQGKRRILLHRKMAETLERLYANDLDVICQRLAVHFDEGRLADRAFEFAMRGSDRAARYYAHRDAIELIRRALRNASSDSQKLDALQRLGDASRIIGNYPEAASSLTDALDLAEAQGDSRRAITLKHQLIVVERNHGGTALDRVRTALQGLTEEARALPAPEEFCALLWQLNELPGQDESEAVARAEEALAAARGVGNPALLARAEFNLGRSFAFGEDPLAAMPHISEALHLYGDLGDNMALGKCHTALGIAHVRSGDAARGLEELAVALKNFEKAADPVNTALVLNNLGVTLIRSGEWEAAEKRLRESLRIYDRLDAAARSLLPLENLTELFYRKEDWPAARDYCAQLLERARATGYWSYEVVALARVGLVALREGDIQAAERAQNAASEILAPHPEWFDERVDSELLSAEVAAARGAHEEALNMLEATEAKLNSRDLYICGEIRLARARVAAEVDVERAVTYARDALSMFEQIGAAPMCSRAQTMLASLGEPV